MEGLKINVHKKSPDMLQGFFLKKSGVLISNANVDCIQTFFSFLQFESN